MKSIEINIVASTALIDDCISVGQMLNALNKAEASVDISAKVYVDMKDLFKDEANRHYDANQDTEKIILGLSTEAEYIAEEEGEGEEVDVDPNTLLRYIMCCGLKDENGDGATYNYFKILKNIAESPLMGAFTYDDSESLCINVIMHLIALNLLDISKVSIADGALSYNGVRIGNMACTHYIRHNSSLVDTYDLDKSTRDAMYLDVFKNATSFAQLTYSSYDDEETETVLENFYADSAIDDRDAFIKFCKNAWGQREESIRVTAINNCLDKLNVKIHEGMAKGESAVTDEDIQATISIWEDAVKYAKTFDCPADWWWHLLYQYVFFLCQNELNAKAYPLAQEWVQMTESELDLDNNDEFYNCYYVAGFVAFGLDMMAEAFTWFDKYLTYAQDHFDQAWGRICEVCHTLACYLIREDDFDNAYSLSRKVIEICAEHPPMTPKDKENLSAYLSVYAHSLKGKRQTDLAIEYYKSALELHYEAAENDTSQLAAMYDNLGNCYDDLSRYDEAIDHHLKAAEILERLYGPTYKDLYFVYSNIAACYTNLNLPTQASEYTQKANAVYWSHPNV